MIKKVLGLLAGIGAVALGGSKIVSLGKEAWTAMKESGATEEIAEAVEAVEEVVEEIAEDDIA